MVNGVSIKVNHNMKYGIFFPSFFDAKFSDSGEGVNPFDFDRYDACSTLCFSVTVHAFLAIVKASVTSQPCLGGFSACALSLPQGVDRLYYFNYTALRHDFDTHTEAVT